MAQYNSIAKENSVTGNSNISPKTSFFQSKLSINQPNDPDSFRYEQEADAIADKVTQIPGTSLNKYFFFKPSVTPIQHKCAHCEEEEREKKLQLKEDAESIVQLKQNKREHEINKINDHADKSNDNLTGLIQKKCSHCEEEEERMQRKESSSEPVKPTVETEKYISSLSGGNPLDKNNKKFFESRIGYDFSGVRIHNDSSANQSAKDIQALAYTHGNNIVFSSGRYQPDTDEGKKLIAHELTHVVQQSGSLQAKVQKKDPPVAATPVKGIELSITVLETDKMPAYFSNLYIAEGSNSTLYYCDVTIRSGTTKSENKTDFNDSPLGSGFYKIYRVDSDSKTFFLKSETGNLPGYIQFGKISSANNAAGEKDDASFEKLAAYIQKIKDDTANASVYIQYPAAKSSEAPDKKPGDKSTGDDLGLAKPAWLNNLEAGVNKIWQDDKTAHASDENIPSSLVYYASKGAQASMGDDTWAVSIRYGEGGTEKTYEYVKPADENKAQAVYDKIKKAVSTAKTQKRSKEFDDKLKVGEEGISQNKWAWAYLLKNTIKAKLDATAKLPAERGHSDFPNKLSLVTREGEDEAIYLKVWVEVADVKKGDNVDPGDKITFSFRGGSLPTALSKEMTADQLIPQVRTMAGALRLFDPTKQKIEDVKVTPDNKDVLPPFPSVIIPKNVREDATVLENVTSGFDMTLQINKVFGNNPLDTVTKFANMPVEYHWGVFKINKEKMQGILGTEMAAQWPERQKALQTAVGDNLSLIKTEELKNIGSMSKSTQGIYETALGENPLFMYQNGTYQSSMDAEYSFDIPAFKSGEFNDYLIYCKAFPQSHEDEKYVRRPSTSFYLVHTVTANELGTPAVSETPDKEKALKQLIDKTTDEKEKQKLENELKDLQAKDKLTLGQSVNQQLTDTNTLIAKGILLKDFITKDSANRKKKTENKQAQDADPIMTRLLTYQKALPKDKDGKEETSLVSLFSMILMRYPPPLYDYGYATDLFISNLQSQKKQLETLTKQIDKSNKHFKDPLKTQRPEVTLVSAEKGGTVFNVLMVLGEAPDSTELLTVSYHLVDVTHPQTFKIYRGTSNNTDIKQAKEEAIAEAFLDFARNSEYGNGAINYRIPPDGTIKKLDSHPGIKKMLEYLVTAAAVTALALGIVATGGTLGAVAAGIGIGAGVLGAGLAINNLEERSERGTFEWDAQTIMDIVSIIGAVVALGSLRAASSGVKAAQSLESARELYGVAAAAGDSGVLTQAGQMAIKAGRTIQAIQKINKAIAIYQWAEMGLSVVLVGWKVNEDIARIKAMGLGEEEEQALIQQAVMEAIQSGAMLMISAGHGISESIKQRGIDKVNGAGYKTMEDKGWVDKNGWTGSAPEAVKKGKAAAPTETEPPVTSGATPRDEDVFKGITPETKTMLQKNPEFARWLMENPMAAYALKLCNSPCFPSFAEEVHIVRLEKILAELKKHNVDVKMKDLKEYFHSAKNVSELNTKLREFEFNANGYMEYLRFKEEFPGTEGPAVSGGQKPKVEDAFGHEHNVPTKKRTRLDDNKLPLTATEAKAVEAYERIQNVVYKKLSDFEEIKNCWNDARQEVLSNNTLTAENYSELYDKARNKFWEKMRTDKHKGARKIMEEAGFILPDVSERRAAILGGVDPSIPSSEVKISLDHIEEKARGDNWKKALDPENLRFEFSMPNTYREIIQARHPELRSDWQVPMNWSLLDINNPPSK